MARPPSAFRRRGSIEEYDRKATCRGSIAFEITDMTSNSATVSIEDGCHLQERQEDWLIETSKSEANDKNDDQLSIALLREDMQAIEPSREPGCGLLVASIHRTASDRWPELLGVVRRLWYRLDGKEIPKQCTIVKTRSQENYCYRARVHGYEEVGCQVVYDER